MRVDRMQLALQKGGVIPMNATDPMALYAIVTAMLLAAALLIREIKG
jgi:hypothetical protein